MYFVPIPHSSSVRDAVSSTARIYAISQRRRTCPSYHFTSPLSPAYHTASPSDSLLIPPPRLLPPLPILSRLPSPLTPLRSRLTMLFPRLPLIFHRYAIPRDSAHKQTRTLKPLSQPASRPLGRVFRPKLAHLRKVCGREMVFLLLKVVEYKWWECGIRGPHGRGGGGCWSWSGGRRRWGH